jgi:hypothetical protein
MGLLLVSFSPECAFGALRCRFSPIVVVNYDPQFTKNKPQ